MRKNLNVIAAYSIMMVLILMVGIFPVILAGGAGTRLWPVSRESMPKQFVSLVGKRSLFQQSVLRFMGKGLSSVNIIIFPILSSASAIIHFPLPILEFEDK